MDFTLFCGLHLRSELPRQPLLQYRSEGLRLKPTIHAKQLARCRWGPVGLDEAKLNAVIGRLEAAADAVSADVTVLRRRQINVATMGDAGGLRTSRV